MRLIPWPLKPSGEKARNSLERNSSLDLTEIDTWFFPVSERCPVPGGARHKVYLLRAFPDCSRNRIDPATLTNGFSDARELRV